MLCIDLAIRRLKNQRAKRKTLGYSAPGKPFRLWLFPVALKSGNVSLGNGLAGATALHY